MRHRIAVIICAFLVAAVALAVRNDKWQVIGPGGGGAQFYPTISPHDPNVVLVGSDMTGSYLTRDGGKNWRMINLRGVPRFYVFDPSDAKTIYARTIGLWRSSDAGTTWELVYPDPKTVTGISMIDDHASEQFQTTGPSESINALAVDPSDSRVLFGVFTGRGGSSLRRSSDRGATWTAIPGEMPAASLHVYVDPQSPPNNRRVYVAGADGVAVVENGTVRRTGPPTERLIAVSAGFPKGGGPLVVYGITRNAVFVSRDGGANWSRSTPGRSLEAVATSLSDPSVAYVSSGSLELPLRREPAARARRGFGVTKTTDYGSTWHDVWKESDEKSPEVDDGWVSPRFGPGWGSNPLALGVSPRNPNLCYATDYGRTLKSEDGGETWKAVYTRAASGGWTTTGLDVTTNYGVHFDPFDPKKLFISYTDIGLFASDDGGRSWTSATTSGVPREWVNTTYWMVFDPEVRGRAWAVMSGTHDLPRPKMWRRGSPATYRGGVVSTDDGGKTWRVMNNGMPQTAATHILLDPRSPATARTLYVAGFGKGVYRSKDGGKTWEPRNEGLPSPEPFAWRLAQDRDGVLYLIIARRSDDGSIGDARDGALYRSRNGADSWEKVPLPQGVNGPNGLAIDPHDPRRLYLATWRRSTAGQDGGGGIYLSTDAGATWKPVLSKDQHIYDVTIDPRDPSVLYAAGFESSAWRSVDRGESWSRIRGYNFKWGHRVIPDPRDRSFIFITTFGGSVWHGPAVGDASANEDIVTPVAAFSR